MPISLDLEGDDLPSEIDRALSTSLMSHSNNGNSKQLIVGLSDQPEEEISSNIRAVYRVLLKSFPGKFENIRSMSIRFANNSWTVPIFISYGIIYYITQVKLLLIVCVII